MGGNTTHVLEYEGRKIWMRKFGYKKALISTADEDLKALFLRIARKTDKVQTMVDIREVCAEDMEGMTSFILDTDCVQLLFDFGVYGFGVLCREPEEGIANG